MSDDAAPREPEEKPKPTLGARIFGNLVVAAVVVGFGIYLEHSLHSQKLRRADSVSFTRSAQVGAGKACLAGSAEIDGEHMHADLFLKEQGDAWKIYTVQVYSFETPPQPWSCK